MLVINSGHSVENMYSRVEWRTVPVPRLKCLNHICRTGFLLWLGPIRQPTIIHLTKTPEIKHSKEHSFLVVPE